MNLYIQTLHIHPSSVLFTRNAPYVIFHEGTCLRNWHNVGFLLSNVNCYFTVVETTKPFMRDLTVIDPAWLSELAWVINRCCIIILALTQLTMFFFFCYRPHFYEFKKAWLPPHQNFFNRFIIRANGSFDKRMEESLFCDECM